MGPDVWGWQSLCLLGASGPPGDSRNTGESAAHAGLETGAQHWGCIPQDTLGMALQVPER